MPSPWVTRAMNGELPGKSYDRLAPCPDFALDTEPCDEFAFRPTLVGGVIVTPTTPPDPYVTCGNCGWLFTDREDRVEVGSRVYHSECVQ